MFHPCAPLTSRMISIELVISVIFFLFLIAYMIQANISGDLWYFSPLLCALGYGLALPNEKCETVPVSGMLEKDAVAFMDRA